MRGQQSNRLNTSRGRLAPFLLGRILVSDENVMPDGNLQSLYKAHEHSPASYPAEPMDARTG